MPFIDKVLDDLALASTFDAAKAALRTLHLRGELDQGQPELAGVVSHGRAGAMVEDGPVVYPLPEGVGVEDAAEEQDGFFIGVPVLQRIARRNTGLGGVLGRRFGRLFRHRRLASLCRRLAAGLLRRGGGAGARLVAWRVGVLV